jgi:putative transposase
LPLLTNDVWRLMLAEAHRAACDELDVALWAYVFMPEHIHLLLKPSRAEYDLAAHELAFNLATSRGIINLLRKDRSPLLEKLAVKKSGGKGGYRFWQPGGGLS